MRRALWNVTTTYVAYAVAILAGLVVTPILFEALGKEGYGVWAFIGSATIFLSLLDLGVGPTVVRFVAEARGRGDESEANALASAAFAVYAAVGAVTVVAGVVLAWLVPVLLDPREDLVWPARVATFLVVLSIAARFPLGLFGSLLAGRQRFDVPALAGLVSNVLLAVLVVALVTGEDDLVLVAAISAVATIVRLALPLAWVRGELPGLQLRRSLVTRERLRRLVGVSTHNFLVHVAGKVVLSADVIVVGILLGAEAAALYGIPAKLFALATATAAAGPTLLLPAFAELEGAEERERQRAFLLSGLRVATALMLLIGLPLVFVPDLFLQAWISDDLGESVPVLVLLALALVPHQIVVLGTQYLLARDRQRSLSAILMATVTANLVLSLVLAPTVGIWGVALATLSTELVAGLLLVPRLLAQVSSLTLTALLRGALRPLPPALAAAALVLVGVARATDPDTLLELAPIGLLWLAVALPAIWFWGLRADERTSMRRLLRPAPALVADPAP
jgi:O-antigen/teichoic acid export membrane protein